MTKGNGYDDPKITKLPSEEERKVLKKARIVHQSAQETKEPVFNLPPVVQALGLISIAVFLFITFFPAQITNELTYTLAFVPARYFGTQPLGFAGLLSPFTHMFLHAGWLHLAINIGMLMAFGAGIEKAIGGRRLLLFYFLTGLFGAFVHALVYPATESPMVGASGAISGLFGGILMLMHAEGLMGGGYRKLLPFVLIWIGVSAFFGYFGAPGVDNPIAWTTHIGGFVSGLFLYRPIRRLKMQH